MQRNWRPPNRSEMVAGFSAGAEMPDGGCAAKEAAPRASVTKPAASTARSDDRPRGECGTGQAGPGTGVGALITSPPVRERFTRSGPVRCLRGRRRTPARSDPARDPECDHRPPRVVPDVVLDLGLLLAKIGRRDEAPAGGEGDGFRALMDRTESTDL